MGTDTQSGRPIPHLALRLCASVVRFSALAVQRPAFAVLAADELVGLLAVSHYAFGAVVFCAVFNMTLSATCL